MHATLEANDGDFGGRLWIKCVNFGAPLRYGDSLTSSISTGTSRTKHHGRAMLIIIRELLWTIVVSGAFLTKQSFPW